VLTRAALLYNCADTGARHARSPRGPGPDLPERLARRGDRLRERSPRAVGALRALRGAWGWLAVVALLVAPLFVPSLDTALPALAAAFVLLFQLAWPARSRTVSFATLLRVAALGALLLWPVAFTAAGLEHLNLNAELANAALHPVSGFVHGLLGGGVLTPWLLVVLLLCAVAMDYRTIGTAAESTPPLPGRPPLAGLRRRARGRSVAMRVRVPADIAPLFRRLALSWVDL
ncbi:PrsW family intramembrane metalloprotease, partial [Nocardiopsis tropica]|nr:PrsW family intramembrane metalloprotease [Nocardiopsis tropica]